MSQDMVATRDRGGGTLLGVPIGRKSLATLTNEALAAIDGTRTKLIFACANPHSIVVAQQDRDFMDAFHDAHQVVADGVGVVLMAKTAGVDVGPRITGTDYLFSLMRTLNARGHARIFFFGSSPNVLELVSRRMAIEFPSLVLCGTLSPPFRPWTDEENGRFIKIINDAQPDVLWVGMTAPKQEKWVYQNRHHLKVPVIASIGAVFDFYAGTHPRAPQWMCKLGVEWLYRLFREPKRMWRRNFISTPKFVLLVLHQHILGGLRW
jgi:N-acetylglucosaminyldiphosphoundecaprenol N-acetyl-beta-D-mannosaminyltransferase